MLGVSGQRELTSLTDVKVICYSQCGIRLVLFISRPSATVFWTSWGQTAHSGVTPLPGNGGKYSP